MGDWVTAMEDLLVQIIWGVWLGTIIIWLSALCIASAAGLVALLLWLPKLIN